MWRGRAAAHQISKNYEFLISKLPLTVGIVLDVRVGYVVEVLVVAKVEVAITWWVEMIFFAVENLIEVVLVSCEAEETGINH